MVCSALLIGSILAGPAIAAAAESTIASLDVSLVEVAALSKAPATWVVLDARPPVAYRAGHLPGAQSFSWEDHTSTDAEGVPYEPGSPESIALELGKRGISETTPIVVYGDAEASWGGEGWACWLLEWLGHRGPVRVLDGGIQAWQAAGLPVTATETALPAKSATYHPQVRARLDIETAELRDSADRLSIVDTRSDEEWAENRIPGAVHIPWNEFFQGKDRRPLSGNELSALLRSRGVGLDRPVVYYCAGGIRSAYAWMVHELSDLPSARNYDGGMEAWKRGK